jgi:UDP-GlcNAc:undecaprenyl-phosphate GlcNAc-1-phosphate transferase
MTIPACLPGLYLVAGLAISFFTCWVVISFILRLCDAHSHTIDRGRDFHHPHKISVPRFGGVGLVAAFMVLSSGIYFSGILSPSDTKVLVTVVLSSLGMFLLGFCDDLRPLGARWKLSIQIALATAVCLSGIRIEIVKNPVTEVEFALGLSGYFATVVWLVTLPNLINLIDGIDGLAGGISLMLMFLLATISGNLMVPATLLSVGVAGALLGFLKFNYPPAKIYMGDCGAYFLGFLIGLLSIINSNKGTVIAALIAPAFALALPVADVSFAVLRRGLRGLPFFRADRRHLHHLLINLGFSRELAVLALYAVSIICLALAFCVFYCQGRLLPLFAGVLVLVLLMFAKLSGLAKNWVAIVSGLGKSLALRKETRYALALSRWLEMEAERHGSIEEIWQDYTFAVRKLGFSRIKLILPESTSTWELEGSDPETYGMQHASRQISDGMTIEFHADKEAMPEILFSLLTDLASEIWHKVVSRWQKINKTSLVFMSETATPGRYTQNRFVRPHAPVQSNPSIGISNSPNESVLTVP